MPRSDPAGSYGLDRTHGLYAAAYVEALEADRTIPTAVGGGTSGLREATARYESVERRHREATGSSGYGSGTTVGNRAVLVPRDASGSPAQGFHLKAVTPETASRLLEAESKHRAAMQRHLEAMNRHIEVVESCRPGLPATVTPAGLYSARQHHGLQHGL